MKRILTILFILGICLVLFMGFVTGANAINVSFGARNCLLYLDAADAILPLAIHNIKYIPEYESYVNQSKDCHAQLKSAWTYKLANFV